MLCVASRGKKTLPIYKSHLRTPLFLALNLKNTGTTSITPNSNIDTFFRSSLQVGNYYYIRPVYRGLTLESVTVDNSASGTKQVTWYRRHHHRRRRRLDVTSSRDFISRCPGTCRTLRVTSLGDASMQLISGIRSFQSVWTGQRCTAGD